MSAIWSWDRIWQGWTNLDWIFSSIKWQSSSICFVHSWNTGFSAIWIAAWLSQWIGMGEVCETRRSSKRYFSHWSLLLCFPWDGIRAKKNTKTSSRASSHRAGLPNLSHKNHLKWVDWMRRVICLFQECLWGIEEPEWQHPCVWCEDLA